LNDKFEEFEGSNKLSINILKNFKEFQQNYNDPIAQKNTKDDVKLMLYNNTKELLMSNNTKTLRKYLINKQ